MKEENRGRSVNIPEHEMERKAAAKAFAMQILTGVKSGATVTLKRHCWESCFPFPLPAGTESIHVLPPRRHNAISENAGCDEKGIWKICGGCFHEVCNSYGLGIDWDFLPKMNQAGLNSCDPGGVLRNKKTN